MFEGHFTSENPVNLARKSENPNPCESDMKAAMLNGHRVDMYFRSPCGIVFCNLS